MTTTSKLFLCLLCLALPLVSGCGNKDGVQKAAMTEAANKLVVAVAMADKAGKVLMDKYPNPNDIPLDELREAFVTFKTNANAISLVGCSDEFKDAFATWEQALIVGNEFIIKFLVDMRNVHALEIRQRLETLEQEGSRLSQQAQDAETRFKAVCRKLELNVQFEDRMLIPMSALQEIRADETQESMFEGLLDQKKQLDAIDAWLMDSVNWFEQLEWLSRNALPAQDMMIRNLVFNSANGNTITFIALLRNQSILATMEEGLRETNHDPRMRNLRPFTGQENSRYSFQSDVTIALSGAIATVQQEQRDNIEELERLARHKEKIQSRLSTMESLALASSGTTRNMAVSGYQSWLIELASGAGLGNVQGRDSTAPSVRNVYGKVVFTLDGEGRLDQIAEFLRRFHRTEYLHMMTNVSPSPSVLNPNIFTVSFRVEVLALPQVSAVNIPGANGVTTAITDEERKMLATVRERAILSEYPLSSSPSATVQQSQQRMKDFDAAPFCIVTAIVELEGRPQCWVNHRTEGRMYYLFESESFTLGGVRVTIKKIDTKANLIQAEVAESMYTVRLGQSFADAEKE